jgi:hypothetical protein
VGSLVAIVSQRGLKLRILYTHTHTQVKYLYFIAVFVKINYIEIIKTYFYVTAFINSCLSLVNKCNVCSELSSGLYCRVK